mmetsp:Transcript_152692/g.489734  ORF Transcript_152692/g.489734 Transcript_152692/m.489734 type:complete len:313 (+) Transcript_152692:861-1799(+)
MAVNFSSLYWAEFFSRFYSLPAAVQVKILELGRKQRERVPDGFLLDLLGYTQIEPSVLQVSILVAADRRLYGALHILQGFLAHPRPAVRAAAAVSIINLGWGVGLGDITTAALLILETMLGEPLEGHVTTDCKDSAVQAARAVLQSRGCTMSIDEDMRNQLEAHATLLKNEWEDAIQAGRLGRAVLLAIQVTQVRSAFMALSRRGSSCLDSPKRLSDDLADNFPEKTRSRTCSEQAEKLWEKSKDSQERCEEIAAALQMMPHLVEPRALLPCGADMSWRSSGGCYSCTRTWPRTGRRCPRSKARHIFSRLSA